MGYELSVVIPVYRSQDSVHLVVEKLHEVLPAHVKAFEIILVDDGSPDDSWSVLERLAAQYPAVRSIRLMRNFGQHNALLCGVRAARYPLCVTMDDDLQHPPEALPTLLEALGTADVVYGSPAERPYSSMMRQLATQMTKLVLQNAMGGEIAQHISPYRLFRTRLREAFADYRGVYVNIDVLLTWGTSRFRYVPVYYNKRTIGQSNYTLRKLITHTLNLVTGFSTLPLQLASLLGFFLTMLGAGILFYVLVIRFMLLGSEVPGFVFLASTLTVFAGAQLFILGIMGEYLARMHFRLMDKPTFVVLEERSQKDNTPHDHAPVV